MELSKINKKGVLGLDLAKKFMLVLFVLVVLGFALLISLNQLNSSSVGTTETTEILSNTSTGLVTFFSNVPTWLVFLGLAIIIIIIGVVVAVVSGFGKGGRGGL